MANLFVHFNTKTAFNAATLGTEYTNNSIVFIKDSQEIWTHGAFYAIPDSYKNKITNLETAVSALQAAQASSFAVRKVSDGTNIFTAASNKETVKFKGGANTSVSVDAASGEITIGSTLTATSYYPNANGVALEGRVSNLEDNVISGEGAIIATTGTNGNTAVSLKLDNTGTVTLSQGAAGLKAQVNNIDSLTTVNGVADNDKILSLTNKKIGSTLSINYNSTDKTIELLGKEGVKISSIDAKNFIKDGMVENATLVQTAESGVTGVEVPYIKITFKTTEGVAADPIRFSVKDLVDIYDGSNLKLKSIAIPSTNAVEPTANDSVDSAVANLIKKDRELNSSINSVSSKVTQVENESLKSIEKGTDGKFVTTTVTSKSSNKQSVSVAVKTDVAIANATNAADGLATAYAVQQYVASELAWAEY